MLLSTCFMLSVLAGTRLHAMDARYPFPHKPATQEELEKLTCTIQYLNSWMPTQKRSDDLKDHGKALAFHGLVWMFHFLDKRHVYDSRERLDSRMGLFCDFLERMFLQEQKPIPQKTLDEIMQKKITRKTVGNICALEEALLEELAVPLFVWLKQHLA